MRLFSNRNRPEHLGRFPLERLPRTAAANGVASADLGPLVDCGEAPLSAVLRDYRALYSGHFEGEPAAARAPIPDDPERLVAELKAAKSGSVAGSRDRLVHREAGASEADPR